MPLFISDEEFAQCSGNTAAVAAKADDFIMGLLHMFDMCCPKSDAALEAKLAQYQSACARLVQAKAIFRELDDVMDVVCTESVASDIKAMFRRFDLVVDSVVDDIKADNAKKELEAKLHSLREKFSQLENEAEVASAIRKEEESKDKTGDKTGISEENLAHEDESELLATPEPASARLKEQTSPSLSADPHSLLEEKEAAVEKLAISGYELRLAQEDISKLE